MENKNKTTFENVHEVTKIVADAVKDTLGPTGGDKLIVNSAGNIITTNDGATIMREIENNNPIAKIMLDVSNSQESKIGDGTSSSIIFSAELINQAKSLIDKGIHPTLIIRGYQAANEFISEHIQDHKIESSIEQINNDYMPDILGTVLIGKNTEEHKDKLVKTIIQTLHENDKDNIRIESKVGGDIGETEVVNGCVIGNLMRSNFPKGSGSKIMIIEPDVEPEKLDNMQFSSVEEKQKAIDRKTQEIQLIVQEIEKVSPDIIICRKGMDDIIRNFFSSKNVLVIERMIRKDMQFIENMFNTKRNNELKDFNIIEANWEYEDNTLKIDAPKDTKFKTILVNGSTKIICDEIKRGIEDCIGVYETINRVPFIVGGAGAIEMVLSNAVKEFAKTFNNKTQMAVEKFAESLEIIPITLAKNSGLDPMDVITELKSKPGNGVNVYSVDSINPVEKGIIEPMELKRNMIKTATEVAVTLLRLKGLIAGKNMDNKE